MELRSSSGRPAVVESAGVLAIGKAILWKAGKRSGLIVTHVERKSRYLIAAKLPVKRCEPLAERTVQVFADIPQSFKKTLTFDNGSEFAALRLIEEQSGFKVYFANPYAAWERGTNENTNGLLRGYFSKGSDFSQITDTNIEQAVVFTAALRVHVQFQSTI